MIDAIKQHIAIRWTPNMIATTPAQNVVKAKIVYKSMTHIYNSQIILFSSSELTELTEYFEMVKYSLSQKGFGIVKTVENTAELQNIREELIVRPKQNGIVQHGAPTITLYRESSKKIYVPKSYGLAKFGVPDIDDTGECDLIDLKFNGTLRQEQIDPVEAFMAASLDGCKRGGIINLSCGAGKTVIGLSLITRLGVKTMILVHKEFLIDQWKERINQFLPEARVGLIKAKIVDVVDKDIIIASLQSLSMKTYDPHVFDGIGFVIVDEVHRTGTEVFSNALHKINFKYALGLSATIDRTDGLSKVFKWFIGDIVYTKKREKDNVTVWCHKFFDTNPIYSTEEMINQSKINISKMINNVCGFAPRDNMIANIIKKLLDIDSGERKILVLSDRIQHLKNIEKCINDIMGNTMMCGFYIGGMKQEALKISETKRVILGTFVMGSEGLDLKGLDTLILASPKTSIEQAVGRILRLKECDRVRMPIIVDIVDCFSVFQRQAKKRAAYYKKCKFVVHDKIDMPMNQKL